MSNFTTTLAAAILMAVIGTVNAIKLRGMPPPTAPPDQANCSSLRRHRRQLLNRKIAAIGSLTCALFALVMALIT